MDEKPKIKITLLPYHKKHLRDFHKGLENNCYDYTRLNTSISTSIISTFKPTLFLLHGSNNVKIAGPAHRISVQLHNACGRNCMLCQPQFCNEICIYTRKHIFVMSIYNICLKLSIRESSSLKLTRRFLVCQSCEVKLEGRAGIT